MDAMPIPVDFETLTVERIGGHVLLVTLDRPDSANAMNTRMGLDLVTLFEAFQVDTDDVRCIVVTGRGTKAFCAGADLKERHGMSDETWLRQHAVFERMVRAILACPVPAIAAVNGAAFGGGCEIASACDFLYASRTARFAFPEVTLGIMPGAGGTQTTARSVGTRRAKEIILTGLPFGAEDAERWGLVNRVLLPEELMPAAIETARRIASNAPISVRQAKQAIARGVDMSIWDGLAVEIEAYNRTVPSDDRREGVAAFNERRKPVFKGR